MRLTMLCLLLALAAANSFADQVIKEGNLQLTLPDGFSTPERSELPTGGVLIKSDVRKLFNLSVLVSKPSGLATLFTPRGVLRDAERSLKGDGRILHDEEFVKDGYCGLRVYVTDDEGLFFRWEAMFASPYLYLLGIAASNEATLTGPLVKKIVNTLVIDGKGDGCSEDSQNNK